MGQSLHVSTPSGAKDNPPTLPLSSGGVGGSIYWVGAVVLYRGAPCSIFVSALWWKSRDVGMCLG